ncbi:MAG: PQQ-binding-like beta-propeller repeat protein [Haloplanus sp.]
MSDESRANRWTITRRGLLEQVAVAGATGAITDGATNPVGAAKAAVSAVAVDATQFQYDPARTGTTAAGGPRTKPVKFWETSDQYAFASAPAVVDGVVYASGTNGLAAFHASDGGKKWTFAPAATDTEPSRHGRVSSSPAIASDTVYVGSSDGNLYAVDVADGEERWRFETKGGVYSSPAVVDDRIYVGSTDGTVYALNPDGEEVWSAGTGRPVLSSPAVAGGTVYVGNGQGGGGSTTVEGGVVALDATSGGARRWSFQPDVPGFEGDGPFYSTPAVSDGTVYIGNRGRRTALYALNAENGNVQWQFGKTPGISIDCSPAVAGGSVFTYTGGKFGTFYALDAADGTPQWQFSTGEFLFATSSPTVADGTVIVAAAPPGNLYALDAASGVPEWQYSLADNTNGSPAVAGRRVYIGDRRGLKALGEETIDVGLTTPETKVGPGDEATVTLRVTNSTSEVIAPELTISLPDVFDITGHTDDGGTYDGSGGPSWTWSDIAAGDSREPTLTLRAKESASMGDYDVDAAVSATLDDGDTLETTASETLTITEAPFDVVKGEKLTLAGRIDEIAETFVETPAVEDALANLTGLVDEGAISQERAIEAVERLKLTEDVSETALVTAGPAGTITPEDGATLVGSPTESNVDIFEKIAKFVIDIKATLLAVVANIARIMASFSISDRVFGASLLQSLNLAKSIVRSFLNVALGVIGPILKAFGVKDAVKELLTDVETATKPGKVLGETLARDKQKLKEDLALRFEQGSEDFPGIREALATSRGQLSGLATESEKPSFSGSKADAESAASTAETDITNEISAAVDQFEAVSIFAKIFSVLGALASLWATLLGPFGFVAGAAIGALTFVGPLAKAYTTLRSGFVTLTRVQVNHDRSLATIVNP